MNTFTAYLAIVFLVVLLVSIFYWKVVHAVLIDLVRYRLFARRDTLRLLAIEGEIDQTSHSYCEVESLICGTLSVAPSISLVSILFFKSSPKRSEADRRVERFLSEATPELKRMYKKTVLDAVVIMALNSPIFTSIASYVILLAWLLGRFNKVLLMRDAESFVGGSAFTQPA